MIKLPNQQQHRVQEAKLAQSTAAPHQGQEAKVAQLIVAQRTEG